VLFAFVMVAMAGAVLAQLFRAPALIAVSFGLVVLGLAGVFAGYCSLAQGFVLLACLQAGYVAGLAIAVARRSQR
jgi:hypothetical protein